MDKIYSWNKLNNPITKDLEFINFLYSKKKDKFYCKLELKDYMVIWFKNDYCIIFERNKKWFIRDTAPLRNYHFKRINWNIIKCSKKEIAECPF